ncbi:MAG: hypothetical protein ABR552_05440, partial [Actinomycetota bacterium]
ALSLAKVAPKNGGGEPSIAISRKGELYVSYPGDAVEFYRSTNGGSTWVAGAHADEQSGDTTVNVDSSGAIYQSNLNVLVAPPDSLQADLYKSKDDGRHWVRGAGPVFGSNTTNNPFFVDRQWTDAYIAPHHTTDSADVYMAYHDFVPSQIWVAHSSDGGKTFAVPTDAISSPVAEAYSFCDTIPGGLRVVQSGPHAGRVYVAWLAADPVMSTVMGCNITQLETFHTVWVGWSDDQGSTWTDQLVYDGGIGHDASALFADLTLDDRGNPYVAFAQNLNGEWDMYVMASFDNGTTWNGKSDGTGAPYKVNADRGTHFFPAIAVGDPGKVDVAYIATSSVIPTLPYGKPLPGGVPDARWYLYFAQALDLTSGHPHWSVVRATPSPIHTGDVCVLGIFCVFPSSNRDLLDFIDLAVDPKGFGHVSYTNDQSAQSSGIWVANQTGGRSVYTQVLAKRVVQQRLGE